jgi:hypothetical protein
VAQPRSPRRAVRRGRRGAPCRCGRARPRRRLRSSASGSAAPEPSTPEPLRQDRLRQDRLRRTSYAGSGADLPCAPASARGLPCYRGAVRRGAPLGDGLEGNVGCGCRWRARGDGRGAAAARARVRGRHLRGERAARRKAGTGLNAEPSDDHGYHIFPMWYRNIWKLVDELGIAKSFVDCDGFLQLSAGQYPHGPSDKNLTSLRDRGQGADQAALPPRQRWRRRRPARPRSRSSARSWRSRARSCGRCSTTA